MILLRALRRRTSLEAADSRTLQEVEFRNRDGSTDLRPSVYEIDDQQGQVVRTHAEHAAGLALKPAGVGVDLAGHDQIRTNSTTGRKFSFAFTDARHRELMFRDEAELLNFIEHILAGLASRSRSAAAREILRYAADRCRAEDQEWLAFMEAGEWKQLIE